MAGILQASGASSDRGDLCGIDGFIGVGTGILVDTHVAVQRHGEMGDANGFDDGQDDGALDVIAGTILSVGIGGSDVEVGDVARTRSER